jgi:hypothetical protein
MTEFLRSQKLAIQYFPERLILQDAMPTTPSGKIQKFRLREMLSRGELQDSFIPGAARSAVLAKLLQNVTCCVISKYKQEYLGGE